MRDLDRQFLARLVWPLALLVFMAALQRPDLPTGGPVGRELGLRPPLFDLGMSLFFLGMAVGQAPAIWLWRRLGSGALAAAALAAGGILAAAASLAPVAGLYWSLRFAAGLAQASLGFAVVISVAQSAPQRRWGLFLALVLGASPLGLALAPWLGQVLAAHPLLGLPSWRWSLFCLDVGTAAVGALVLTLRWPKGDLDAALGEELAIARRVEAGQLGDHSLIGRGLLDLRTWLWAMAGLALFAATAGIALLGARPGFSAPLAWCAVTLGLWISGASSDRFGARYWHVGLCAVAGAVALSSAVMPGLAFPMRSGLLALAGLFIGGALGSFWPAPLRRLKPAARPTGVALIGAACAAGLAAGEPVIGWSRFGGPNIALPVYLLANLLLMGAAMMLCAASFDLRLDATRPRPAQRF